MEFKYAFLNPPWLQASRISVHNNNKKQPSILKNSILIEQYTI